MSTKFKAKCAGVQGNEIVFLVGGDTKNADFFDTENDGAVVVRNVTTDSGFNAFTPEKEYEITIKEVTAASTPKKTAKAKAKKTTK